MRNSCSSSLTMTDFVIRITRVRRVVQQADATISADTAEEAEELAAEHDVNGWETIDGETMHRDEKVLGIKEPGQARLKKHDK